MIAIIGILVALLLPAVQAAREAARRTQCTSQMKNLVLAMVNAESTHGSLPSSGWAGNWSGDPDRGYGEGQPGGWFFSVLPYIEEQGIHDMGSGETGATRIDLIKKRDATPIKIANCPSRRPGGPYKGYTVGNGAANGDGLGGNLAYIMDPSARCDYAVSAGDMKEYDNFCLGRSPASYAAIPADFPPKSSEYSGVSFCGTAVRLKQITDGLSKTVVIGEKWVPIEFHTPDGLPRTMVHNGNPIQVNAYVGDDWGMLVGFQDDTVRSMYYDGQNPTHTPQPDSADVVRAISGARPNDVPTSINSWIPRELFGSSHPGGCLMAMCDGSVSLVQYDVDPEVFRQMGDRKDGGVTKPYTPPGRGG